MRAGQQRGHTGTELHFVKGLYNEDALQGQIRIHTRASQETEELEICSRLGFRGQPVVASNALHSGMRPLFLSSEEIGTAGSGMSQRETTDIHSKVKEEEE